MSDVEPGERESVSVQLRREYRGEDTPSAGNPHSSPATELCGDELFRPPTSSRDKALRQVTIASKPSTIAEMRAFVNGDTGSCRELSCHERDILSHNPLPGKDIPEPCIAPGCKFGHDPSKAAAEYADLLATEAALAADKSKRGKSKFTEWGMQHAWKGPTPHLNVRPGLHGRPLFRDHMKKQILDGFHHSELGAPKTPFKHGLLNNASD